MLAAWILAAALSSSTPDDPVAAAAQRFSGFDLDEDGVAEIGAVTPLGDHAAPDADRPVVLILVEARLLDPLESPDPAPDLGPLLARLQADLDAEGFAAHLLRVAMHRGGAQRDGLQVLALRRFLQDVRAAAPRLAGVLLVGTFPHARLVRTCNWRKRTPLVLHAGTPQEKRFADVDYLRSVPELVAHTCDLVLADLDGNWNARYVRERVRLPTLVAVFEGGVPDRGGVTVDFERGAVTYHDFFHVNDGRVETGEVLDDAGGVRALHVIPRDPDVDDECTPADRALPNRIAHPDVWVSRLDARGVALALRPEYLDAEGRPRRVEFEGAVPPWHDAPWRFDAALERRLLAEYLDRNHAYRTGALRPPFRPASLAHELPSGFAAMCAASPAWRTLDSAGLDVNGADLIGAVRWLREPAVLRTVRAHSDPWGSAFRATDVTALEAECGVPWSFTPRGQELVPSLQAACAGGKLDFFLLYTLWRNRALSGSPSFYVHSGCEAISPPSFERPWWDPAFNRRNGANALLFYAEGLALVGRAKVFYDEPRGFAEALGGGATFGAAWMRTFDEEATGPTWDHVGGDIGRKRAYFWSVLGDASLRLTIEP